MFTFQICGSSGNTQVRLEFKQMNNPVVVQYRVVQSCFSEQA